MYFKTWPNITYLNLTFATFSSIFLINLKIQPD
jgi:hypothetical protein